MSIDYSKFDEIQITKGLLLNLHWTQYLDHDNLCQFNIF
jgi:hypothetical protein